MKLPSISHLLIDSPPSPPLYCSIPPLQGNDPPQRLRLPSSPIKHSFQKWNYSPPISSASSVCSIQDHIRTTQSVSPLPSYLDDEFDELPTKRQRSVSTSAIPNTQIVFDAAGEPKLKRKRGRPPAVQFDGSWTFLTPTVWDIHISKEQQKEKQSQSSSDTESVMHDSMAAFTNSNMDIMLHMPRKKRGRKPKTHLVGNSCFVWKDLTLSKSKKSNV